jgi:hypothetical protein
MTGNDMMVSRTEARLQCNKEFIIIIIIIIIYSSFAPHGA